MTEFPKPVKIKRHGMEVSCYGEWTETSNAVICGDWCNGDEMEEIWAEGAKNWTEAVTIVTEWALREGHVIYEMQSC